MNYPYPGNQSSVGIRMAILDEIQVMLENLECQTLEHLCALLWIKSRIRRSLIDKDIQTMADIGAAQK